MNEEKRFSLVVDPNNGHFTKAVGRDVKEELLQGCGLIPSFVVAEMDSGLPFKEIFEKQYSFGIYEMKDGFVEDGVYKYPEDPDLYPFISIEDDDEIMFQYAYGIVAIVNKDTDACFVCRMD